MQEKEEALMCRTALTTQIEEVLLMFDLAYPLGDTANVAEVKRQCPGKQA